MLIVQKYGGSSVADKEKIYNAARRISETYKSGSQVVVVVSAQGDTTDELIDMAASINEDASKRELDMLLSTGEQMSAALMVMALDTLGCSAVSLNAWQAAIFTTNEYGGARISAIDTKRIINELDSGKIVIVAGFQGINEKGDITTLGRGGSDTTAAALAAALKADKCEIYTDVEGVFTADPRITENAVKLDSINYSEMLEYTSMGAKVLHNRSVELSKNKGVNMVVRSSFSDENGTSVSDLENSAKAVCGIAANKNTVLVRMAERNLEAFLKMAEENISVDMAEGSTATEFVIAGDELKRAEKALSKYSVQYIRLSKVSVVGTGIQSNPQILAEAITALEKANISIKKLSVTEIKISVLVAVEDCERAVRVLHEKLIETAK